jgi:hypothetical protein
MLNKVRTIKIISQFHTHTHTHTQQRMKWEMTTNEELIKKSENWLIYVNTDEWEREREKKNIKFVAHEENCEKFVQLTWQIQLIKKARRQLLIRWKATSNIIS